MHVHAHGARRGKQGASTYLFSVQQLASGPRDSVEMQSVRRTAVHGVSGLRSTAAGNAKGAFGVCVASDKYCGGIGTKAELPV